MSCPQAAFHQNIDTLHRHIGALLLAPCDITGDPLRRGRPLRVLWVGPCAVLLLLVALMVALRLVLLVHMLLVLVICCG